MLEHSNLSDDIYTNIFTSVSATKALLLFHGYPSKSPITKKNYDIAKLVHTTLDIDSYLLHYQGLGSSKGNFSFAKSIKDSISFATSIAQNNKYEEIYLLGHSWGGLVALNVADVLQCRVSKIILFSPFSLVPPDKQLEALLKAEIQENPDTLKAENFALIMSELQAIRTNHNPRAIIQKKFIDSINIKIIQSDHDHQVPMALTRDFVNNFNKTPEYVEFDTDHSFVENREAILNMVTQFLQ